MNGRNILVWGIVFIFFVIVLQLFQASSGGQNVERLSYSDFIARIDQREILQAEIDGDIVKGTLENGSLFVTSIPQDAAGSVADRLNTAGAQTVITPKEQLPLALSVLFNILPFLIFLAFIFFVMRQMQGAGGKAMGFGKSRAKLLTERHRGVVDFQIRNTSSILETALATQDTLTILLASVAAISLLVGGIGVMNIMLVSVTERTREIGVRMATGARMSNILLQFNTEALVVCGIGGLVGVALGIAVALIVQSFGVAILLSPLPAILAFSCAFLTGLLFGYLPARKAAQMDPVVALSYE